MANKNIFGSKLAQKFKVPATDTLNEAGGVAYSMDDKHALAQLAVTNCFNGTFYCSDKQLLEYAKEATSKLKHDPEFLAKVAIYARETGRMKDMAAFIMVVLADAYAPLFRSIFNRVIDSSKMLMTFCQIARSGATGRKFNLSAGTCRRAIQGWFDARSPNQFLNDSIGNNPSMKEILKLAHPKPDSESKAAAMAWLLDGEIDHNFIKTKFVDKDGKLKVSRQHKTTELPVNILEYELFRRGIKRDLVPKVDFRLLDNLNLTKDEYVQVAINSSWNQLRMNLNHFARKGVFENKEVTKALADRLSDKEVILAAKVFPYQLFTAYKFTQDNNDIPNVIKNALLDACEIATSNTPNFGDEVIIGVDVSGSMDNSITGDRDGATSKIRCVDVAALFASCILRNNRNSTVIPFDGNVHQANLNARDSIITNAEKLSKFGGGSTNCALVPHFANTNALRSNLMVIISDYESWKYIIRDLSHTGSGLMYEWKQFKRNNPKAKLVCIDITPQMSAQVVPDKDILLVGGFSDSIFKTVADFVEHNNDKDRWIKEIESIQL